MDLIAKAISFLGSRQEEDLRSVLGALNTMDWKQALVARGYGYHVDVGAFSTPITGGGAGTVLDQDQPEFIIEVPNGYTLVPLQFLVEVAPGVQTTDDHEAEILIAVAKDMVFDGVNPGTVEAMLNMRDLSISNSGPLRAWSAFTANITNPTLDYELAHALTRENFGDATGTELVRLTLDYRPQTPPFIVGPSLVIGYFGGDIAAVGFANLDMLCIPSAAISELI